MTMPRLHIICGHGAGDPGAGGYGYSEAERVRALGNKIKALGGSSVVLHDTSVNYYKSASRWDSLNIPDGECLVELHMDSSDSASAHGAHVIINAGIGGADKWDRALASKLSQMFPGRASTIVERSDLANPKRASARGINYRLVENGFISNRNDLTTFNARLTQLANIYLDVFGIEYEEGSPAKEPSGRLKVDGYWGGKTTRRAQELCGTPVDGVVSSQDDTWRSSCPGCTNGWEWLEHAVGSQLMMALQRKWGVDPDGFIGPKTINAMISYYRKRGSGAKALDSRLDAESLTIKQFQREMNAGRI